VEEVIVKKKVRVKNKKTGETTTQEKNVTKHQKKFHGYLFAEVEFNDQILYVFRETSGVGDFVGASLKRAPAPMTDSEVQSMLTGVPDPNRRKGGKSGKVVVKLDFEKGDKVRIKSGAFTNSEGEVKVITEPKDPTETPKVTVEVTLWGRPVSVEVDYWEVDKV
jgi:transcriptional antiterminator NusG